MGLTTRGDGAKKEADGCPGLGLKVVTFFQALSDHERIGEWHNRAHDNLGSLARVDRLEFEIVGGGILDQRRR